MTVYEKIGALLTPFERRNVKVLLVLMVIGMGMEMLGIGLIIPAIVLMTKPDLAASYPKLKPLLNALGNPDQVRLVMSGILALVAIYLIKMLFLAFLAWRQTRFTMRLQIRLSQQLFSTYLRLPYTFHLQRNSAQLIRNTGSVVDQFTGSTIAPAMILITDGLVLLGITSLLVFFEPLGALIVTLATGVSAWAFNRITRSRILRWGETRIVHDGLRIQQLQEGLGGVKDIKLLGREDDFLEQYRIYNTRSAIAGQLQQTLQQLPRLWLELLAVAGIAILVLTMLAQDRSMTRIVPVLGLFTAAAFRLMPSVSRVLNAIQSMRFGLPVIDTLYEELKLAGPEPEIQTSQSKEPFYDKIRLADIGYTYPGASLPTLHNISLTIRKGESVGFIGSSGSGKSTLVDVILGLLTPTTGQITVDSKDVQQNIRAWQDQIGYVPQSIYLTDDTLRRNVAFGLAGDQIDDAAVNKAIGAAQLEEFVSSLPLGLETRVGERGVQLSGGQRQRVGIARALYHDPSVLVLDEATSALDTTTEQGVMQAVTTLHGTKTILIVAHRLSTLQNCDTIYKLEKGITKRKGET